MQPQKFKYNNDILTIRNMTHNELPLAPQWATNEGWLVGLYDSECFWSADPAGFFVAEFQGKIIGMMSAVAYNESYGFIGLFIVAREHRGSRVGVYLSEVALKYLANRIIGADGVIKKLKNYAALGFKEQYRIVRYQGISIHKIYHDLISAQQISFDQILNYDQQCSPAPRARMLEKWINQPESVTLCSMQNKTLNGYGTLRKCSVGYEIGPLFADNKEIALNLTNALISTIVGQTFYIKIPMANQYAQTLASEYNLQTVFEVGRIYKNGVPLLPIDKIYATTSFEVG